MMILTSVVSLVVLGLLIYLLVETKRRGEANGASTIQLFELLKNQLNETLYRSTAESRQALTEQLGRESQNIQVRLLEQLQQFGKLIRDDLGTNRQEISKSFFQIEERVDKRLELITRTVQERLDKNLSEGFKHFEKVQFHLKNAEVQLAQLGVVGSSIVELNNLLKLPHLRGGFGETTLELILENFFPQGSYELQYAIDPEAKERVDAALRINNLWLPIDSKFPRERVLPLFETSTEEQLLEARRVLNETVKAMAKDIADKYIKPECGTTDMGFMFLPSETLYFEVIRNAKCWEYCVGLKVFPVSPNTLAITLHAMKKSVEFQELAKGVEKTLQQIGIARKHFQHFERKFDEVGKGLTKAQEAFMTAHNHLGRYSGSVTRLTGDTPEETGPEKIDSVPEAPSLP